MGDCIFCKIAKGEIPSPRLLETERCLVFKDINPTAPVHLLVIPKKHFANIGELGSPAGSEDREILADLFLTAAQAAKEAGVAETGYRLVLNVGPQGGQEVPHVHIHLLGGRRLGWPAG